MDYNSTSTNLWRVNTRGGEWLQLDRGDWWFKSDIFQSAGLAHNPEELTTVMAQHISNRDIWFSRMVNDPGYREPQNQHPHPTTNP